MPFARKPSSQKLLEAEFSFVVHTIFGLNKKQIFHSFTNIFSKNSLFLDFQKNEPNCRLGQPWEVGAQTRTYSLVHNSSDSEIPNLYLDQLSERLESKDSILKENLSFFDFQNWS